MRMTFAGQNRETVYIVGSDADAAFRRLFVDDERGGKSLAVTVCDCGGIGFPDEKISAVCPNESSPCHSGETVQIDDFVLVNDEVVNLTDETVSVRDVNGKWIELEPVGWLPATSIRPTGEQVAGVPIHRRRLEAELPAPFPGRWLLVEMHVALAACCERDDLLIRDGWGNLVRPF